MQPTQYLNVLRARRRHALQVRSVSRIYPGGTRALDDVSFSVDGGLCVVVGPAAAGKSTLLRILSLEDRPDRGTVHLGDFDAASHATRLRQLVRAVPLARALPSDMTIAEAADRRGRSVPWSKGASIDPHVETQLRQVGLWDARDLRVDTVSAAMRWRLQVAHSLADSPRALVLDEPLTGVVPAEVRERLALLRDIAQSRIVVISANDVEQLRDLSMQLVILDRGRLLREGVVDRLVDELRGRVWRGAVEPEEVSTIASQHLLLSQASLAHAVQVEVCAEAAPTGQFRSVEPDISHVYREALANRGR